MRADGGDLRGGARAAARAWWTPSSPATAMRRSATRSRGSRSPKRFQRTGVRPGRSVGRSRPRKSRRQRGAFRRARSASAKIRRPDCDPGAAGPCRRIRGRAGDAGRRDRVLAPALEPVRALKARPIGMVLDTPIRRRAPISPLGKLFTDAMLASVPGADVALNNSSGGLRADLPAGAADLRQRLRSDAVRQPGGQIRLTGRELRQVLPRTCTEQPRARFLRRPGPRSMWWRQR